MHKNNTTTIKNYNLQHEIQSVSQIFNKYGFTFMDLHKCSPKSKKAKNICEKAVVFVLNNKNLLDDSRDNSDLPIESLFLELGIPRKLLINHRNYIIAAIEILNGNYPYLAGYFKFIKRCEN